MTKRNEIIGAKKISIAADTPAERNTADTPTTINISIGSIKIEASALACLPKKRAPLSKSANAEGKYCSYLNNAFSILASNKDCYKLADYAGLTEGTVSQVRKGERHLSEALLIATLRLVVEKALLGDMPDDAELKKTLSHLIKYTEKK